MHSAFARIADRAGRGMNVSSIAASKSSSGGSSTLGIGRINFQVYFGRLVSPNSRTSSVARDPAESQSPRGARETGSWFSARRRCGAWRRAPDRRSGYEYHQNPPVMKVSRQDAEQKEALPLQTGFTQNAFYGAVGHSSDVRADEECRQPSPSRFILRALSPPGQERSGSDRAV